MKSEIEDLENFVSALDRNKKIIHQGNQVEWEEGGMIQRGKIISFSEVDKSTLIETDTEIKKVPLADIELVPTATTHADQNRLPPREGFGPRETPVSSLAEGIEDKIEAHEVRQGESLAGILGGVFEENA